MPDPAQPVPDEFAEMLGALLAPGEADAAAEVLERALGLDDQALAEFMDAAAALVRRSRRPLTAAELRTLYPQAR